MGFVDAVKSGFVRFLDIHTRSSRSEFWWWYLFTFLVSVGLGALTLGGLSPLLSLILVVPTWTLFVRRLHDIGHSGWWVLLLLVPVVNFILWVYAAFKPSDPLENPWG